MVNVLDAHMHFFSRDFFRLLAAQAGAAQGKDPEQLLAVTLEKAGIELPAADPAAQARRWLLELDRHGVERAVVFASLPGEAEAVLAGARAGGGRLVPYLLVDPTTPEGLEAGRRGLAELGFRGVLLYPALHRFDPAAPALDPLYAEAGRRRAPVVVHCGLLEIRLRDLLGVRPAYDIRGANPLAVAAAAERHRATRYVLPHFGGGFFAEALLAGAQSPNVFVDTSSSNSWMRARPEELSLAAVMRRALAAFGPRRILFGTDSSTFPRGWRADILAAQREALAAAGCGGEDTAQILGRNLAEILDEA
jgi:predicted TIM-barrel fold metal-dependent hydrolase